MRSQKLHAVPKRIADVEAGEPFERLILGYPDTRLFESGAQGLKIGHLKGDMRFLRRNTVLVYPEVHLQGGDSKPDPSALREIGRFCDLFEPSQSSIEPDRRLFSIGGMATRT
jgi:hypothetical protein